MAGQILESIGTEKGELRTDKGASWPADRPSVAGWQVVAAISVGLLASTIPLLALYMVGKRKADEESENIAALGLSALIERPEPTELTPVEGTLTKAPAAM